MNAHPDAPPPLLPPPPRDAAAATFAVRPHALCQSKLPSLPPPPPPPGPTLSHAHHPPMQPPPRPPDAPPTPLAAAAPPPQGKLHAPYLHRPVVNHASYLYPLHHQMMTPVAHVPIGAAHYAHLPPSIWPPPHQYPAQHLPHPPVVAHMPPSYSLQHPPPVAYTYAPLHTAPLPSIKPPPPHHPYSHHSIPYHMHQHHVLHQSTQPPSQPSHHQHPNVSAPQSASTRPEIPSAPIVPTSAPIHPPEPPNVAAPLAHNAPKHTAAAATSATAKQRTSKENGRTSRAVNSVAPARKPRKPYTMTKTRELWSPEEHARFVQALKLYDRDWKRIETYIGSKTVLQIRSHAQKHFGKVAKYNTGEYIPPPRPKKRASLPYPRTRNANGSKPVAASSGTASDSGNGSEPGTGNGSATNGNSSEGFRPMANGTVRHAEPSLPHKPTLSPVPPVPNRQKWAPNGYTATGGTDHPNGTSSLYKVITPNKPYNDQGNAHIRNLVDVPQPPPASVPGSSSHVPCTVNDREEQRPPGQPVSAAHEPTDRFIASNGGQCIPNGYKSAGTMPSDMSNPNSSLHVLSNCVDMMTRDALPPRQPAAGWASAAAARRAHRAKVVRSRKTSRSSSPRREKHGTAKVEVVNGKHGTAAVRKNGLVQNELSTTANNMVQKRERSPPIVQTDEERKQVGPPDSQRSSSNSSNGKSMTNGEFNENGRPSANETGNGLSSGGSGTGNSPENSDLGIGDDEPRSSNDGSGYDGNRSRVVNGDCVVAEPISSNSSRNSPKRGSSITHLLSDPSTTVVKSEGPSPPAEMEVVRRVAQHSPLAMEMCNGDMQNSQPCREAKAGVVRKETTLRNSQQEQQAAVGFHQSVYIAGEKKEMPGVSIGNQGHRYHKNGALLHVDCDLSKQQQNGHVGYGGAPDIGTKRLRSPPSMNRTGCVEDEGEYGRDRKAQRTRQSGEPQSLKVDYGANDGITRPAKNGVLQR